MPEKKPHTRSELWDIFLDAFLVNNVVLVQAVGLCPVIAAATNLKSGVALAICTILTLLPTSVCMSLFGEKLPSWLRPVVYTLMASILLMVASIVLDKYISEAIFAKLYLFLPLMAVNTIFTYRAGGFSVNHHPLSALMDAAGSALGFSVVICLISALREVAATACLWEIPLGYHLTFREAAQPFAGFVIVGFMAALLQWGKRRFHARQDEKTEEEQE